MTTIKVTIETDAELIMAHLHLPPSHAQALWLACPGETEFSDMEDGFYYVSLSASGQNPGERVKVTFETPNGSATRYRWVRNNGNIHAMIEFSVRGGEVQ